MIAPKSFRHNITKNKNVCKIKKKYSVWNPNISAHRQSACTHLRLPLLRTPYQHPSFPDFLFFNRSPREGISRVWRPLVRRIAWHGVPRAKYTGTGWTWKRLRRVWRRERDMKRGRKKKPRLEWWSNKIFKRTIRLSFCFYLTSVSQIVFIFNAPFCRDIFSACCVCIDISFYTCMWICMPHTLRFICISIITAGIE